MSKKKILFISSWYPSRTHPFYGDFVQRHAQAVSLLHEVITMHVVYDSQMCANKEFIENTQQGFREYYLYYKLPSFFVILKPIIHLILHFKLYKKIIAIHNKPDVIHAHVMNPIGIVAYILKKLYHIPYVCTEHWSGYANSYISKPKLWLLKRIARNASCVMPVSSLLQQAMELKGINAQYSIIPNVVDTSVFTPLIKQASAPHRIIHVSSLNNEFKNIRGILRAIQSLSRIRQDFVLDIVSDNSGDDMLKYAQELSIESFVKFHGCKQRTELASMMAQSAFFVLFSNYETFSCVLIEALAAGIPVITTISVGVAPHISADKGLVIPTGNEDSLTKAMNEMLDKYSTYNSTTLHNYAHLRFSYRHIAQEIHSIYLQAIEQ